MLAIFQFEISYFSLIQIKCFEQLAQKYFVYNKEIHPNDFPTNSFQMKNPPQWSRRVSPFFFKPLCNKCKDLVKKKIDTNTRLKYDRDFKWIEKKQQMQWELCNSKTFEITTKIGWKIFGCFGWKNYWIGSESNQSKKWKSAKLFTWNTIIQNNSF